MGTTVNTRVKMLRNHLNLSQDEFANRIGMSQVGVYKMETSDSKPRRSTLLSICNIFSVSEKWLIDGKGEMKFEDGTEPKTQELPQTWKDAAFDSIKNHNEHLEKEVQFLREMLQNITGKLQAANFSEAFSGAGNLQIVGESVRVAA